MPSKWPRWRDAWPGAVNARWQDFVGTGQFFRGLEPTVARVRDRITAAVTGKRDAAEPLEQAILNSYNDGLTPVIALMVPLVIVALLVLLPLREERLKETID